jgi:hypothetical protein
MHSVLQTAFARAMFVRLIVLLGYCYFGGLAAPLATSVTVPWDVKFQIGQGINSATGDPRSPLCVTSLATTNAGTGGDTTEFSFKGIATTAEMHKELDVSAGASYAGFGFSASAHASYVESQTLSHYEAAYVLKVRVTKSNTIQLDASKAQFKEELNKRSNLAQLCGDSFVQAAEVGGVMYAVFRTSKDSFQESKGSSVSVSGSGWGAEIEAAVKSATSNSKSSSTLHIDFLTMGGTGADWKSDSAPFSFDTLKIKATNFPEEVDRAPWPFRAILMPWQNYFPNFDPAKAFDARIARDQIDLLISTYDEVVTIQRSIQYLRQIQSEVDDYNHLDKTCLQPLTDACADKVTQIRTTFDAITASYDAKIQQPSAPDGTCLPKMLTTTCHCDHVGEAPPNNHYTCADEKKSAYCTSKERCMTYEQWAYPANHDFSRVCKISCHCNTPGGGLHHNGFTCSEPSMNAYCSSHQICARHDEWVYPGHGEGSDSEWRSICRDSITVNSTIV